MYLNHQHFTLQLMNSLYKQFIRSNVHCSIEQDSADFHSIIMWRCFKPLKQQPPTAVTGYVLFIYSQIDRQSFYLSFFLILSFQIFGWMSDSMSNWSIIRSTRECHCLQSMLHWSRLSTSKTMLIHCGLFFRTSFEL